MGESLNDAVFGLVERTIGVAVVCEVRVVGTSPSLDQEAVGRRFVLLAEKGVGGRPVQVVELVLGETTTATFLLADEEEIRAADVRGWMAEACGVPVERVTVKRFVGTRALIGASEDEEEDLPDLNGWWRDR
jgi:hypothetical protein